MPRLGVPATRTGAEAAGCRGSIARTSIGTQHWTTHDGPDVIETVFPESGEDDRIGGRRTERVRPVPEMRGIHPAFGRCVSRRRLRSVCPFPVMGESFFEQPPEASRLLFLYALAWPPGVPRG